MGENENSERNDSESYGKVCGTVCDDDDDDVLGDIVDCSDCVCLVMISSTCGGNSRLFGDIDFL